MKILEGKPVAEKIVASFEERISNLTLKPKLTILGMNIDEASKVYIKKIQKNCEKFSIGFDQYLAEDEDQSLKNYREVSSDKSNTGIMFIGTIPQNLAYLINTVIPIQDVEGLGAVNMGKLFGGNGDALIPCTSRAAIEILQFYNVDLTGKKVVIVGRSNTVGKPLIPQLLKENATVTICHSKTTNLSEEIKQADVVIMAIGKPRFLKKEDIKENAILIDIGINYEEGKLVGDIDFEDIKEKASACTPVPGGVGVVTNMVLIDNIIKSAEGQEHYLV